MLRKIAHSGLKYERLKLAFERGGTEGIENIFGGKNDSGKVRVTRTKSIIVKIVDHFNASMILFLFTSLIFEICMSFCIK